MDVTAVTEAAHAAVDAVRGGKGPFLLECRTYRFRPHSMFDSELYRTKDEVAEWRKRDPIELLAGRMTEAGLLDEAGRAALEAEVAAEVEAAVTFAETGTWEPVEELTRFVVSERRAS
jgi:TPP-dependent pyruvate/acetoin dehydrogenase alpha subunit